jgi:hypothetical protein
MTGRDIRARIVTTILWALVAVVFVVVVLT